MDGIEDNNNSNWRAHAVLHAPLRRVHAADGSIAETRVRR